MRDEGPTLAIEKLSLSYFRAGGTQPALRDIDLTLCRGEILGLVGESGSGKSTLLFAIMNYLAANARVDSGAIRFDGRDLLRLAPTALARIRGRRIAMVYQDATSALHPGLRIGAQIAEVRRFHFHETTVEATSRCSELLRTVGFDEPGPIAHAYPHQLSGGQRQRAMIAMALAGEPELLLLDEPTTALDVEVQAHILRLVRGLRDRFGIAILFVSHDLAAIAELADRIAVLYDGELMEVGSAQAILHRSGNPYTRALIAALPKIDRTAPLEAIPGTASKSPGRFSHCVFIERCGLTAAVCGSRPELASLPEPGWRSRCHFAHHPLRLASWPISRGGSREASPPTRAPALLEVSELTVDYHRRLGFRRHRIEAVRGVSFQVRQGAVVAIVGESGSGKTTLARALLRLVRRRDGRAIFDGADIFSLDPGALRRYRQRVQMVFQNPASSLNPRHSVEELVSRPLRLAGLDRDVGGTKTSEMLTAVGLDPAIVLSRRPHELSGGEKQRVAIARAFVTHPALVVLDEPTTALDVSVQAGILNLLARLRSEFGCTYLLISHDLAVVRHIADEVIVMRAGSICEWAPVEKLFRDPSHPYTRALLKAAPRFGA